MVQAGFCLSKAPSWVLIAETRYEFLIGMADPPMSCFLFGADKMACSSSRCLGSGGAGTQRRSKAAGGRGAEPRATQLLGEHREDPPVDRSEHRRRLVVERGLIWTGSLVGVCTR